MAGSLRLSDNQFHIAGTTGTVPKHSGPFANFERALLLSVRLL